MDIIFALFSSGSSLFGNAIRRIPTRLKWWLPAVNVSSVIWHVQALWLQAGLYALGLALDNRWSYWLYGFVAFYTLRQFFTDAYIRRGDRVPILIAYLLIPAQLALATFGLWLPWIWVAWLIPVVWVLVGERDAGWQMSAMRLLWGAVGCVGVVVNATLVTQVAFSVPPVLAGIGLYFYLGAFQAISWMVWHGR